MIRSNANSVNKKGSRVPKTPATLIRYELNAKS
jgi:hypothetical protein